jgi:RNA polymerase sigma factor (sigma-70 family)
MAEDGTFRENLIASIPACAPSLSRSSRIATGRRHRSGHDRARLAASRPVRGGHQFWGLALHDPAQPRLLGPPQAGTRGRGRGRLLFGAAEDASDQQSHLDFEDFQRALQTIPLDQREALLLVAAEGLSYEEAAEITGVAVGTVKSRVNRARGRLARLLAVERDEDVGPDSLIKAAMQG